MSYNLTNIDQCVTTVAACSQITGAPEDLLIKYYGGYGYLPSIVMAAVFLALYGITTIAHLVQALKKPRFMWVMVVGGLVELIGWGGRVWSRYVLFGGGYIMQICCLVIAPTFFSAALYMILGDLIRIIKPSASPVSSKKFKIFFILADFVSLVVQAVGGGLAATANTDPSEKAGSNIMLAGIVIQLIVMVVYVACALYWVSKSSREIRMYGSRIPMLLLGMSIASLAIILRGCYRTAELSQNFDGPIAQDELLFLLDGIPIVTAMVALNIFHPARLLNPIEHENSLKTRESLDTFVMEGNPAEKRV